MEEQEVKKPVQIEPIEWESANFETHRRGWSWYLIVAIVLLLVLIYTIYIGRWLLVGVVVMVGVALYLSGRMSPEKVSCRIDNDGMTIGNRTFVYDQLKTFWISKSKEATKLNIISIQRFMPVISLGITDELGERIRGALGNRLPESKNQQEDLIDRINRFLKI
ncbi:hypothetical protein JXA59_00155 [Patescibacteria group bacterium]|nr:hypothetical protein [Patescibacteria group bacterium]